MRSRELSLVIVLLALALFAIGANSAYATHTPVANNANQKILGAAQLTVTLLNPTTVANTPPTTLSGTTTLTLRALPTINTSFGALTYPAPAPAGTLSCTRTSLTTVECPFGGIIRNLPNGGSVQITNKSATALAKIVATKGDTSNNLLLKDYKVVNLANPDAVVAVQLTAEFNFPSSSIGKGHGYSVSTTFNPFVTTPGISSIVNDRVRARGEFSYIDGGLVTYVTEPIGGALGVNNTMLGNSLTVDYTPSGGVGSNVMSRRCVLEGNTTILNQSTCPAPTGVTDCPGSLGTCPVENIFLSQIIKLGADQYAEMGGGNMTASGDEATVAGEPGGTCQMQADLNSEGWLSNSDGRTSCELAQENALFNPEDKGCFKAIVYSRPEADLGPLGNCDPATIRIAGTETKQIQCSDLNGDGLDDCKVTFCKAFQAGVQCGVPAATLDVEVTCNMTETCVEAHRQGNNLQLSETSGVFTETLVCALDFEVSPCSPH